MSIQFLECQKSGYAARTNENILNSDVTIAFAINYNSAGEILTKRLCGVHSKFYIQFPMTTSPTLNSETMDEMGQLIKEHFGDKPLVVNIAGNGIYTLHPHFSQDSLDFGMGFFLHNIRKHINIIQIRSGGQTGIDEAGLKAADRLGIPAICLAPKGWAFRNIYHKDIYDEQQFKSRFPIPKTQN